ncbi:hypothetical protein OMAG_000979 [Candidatus Omnitrophus magneticus]|uniref:Uncharacterized protein n=1 Tax=Candidatus Omnitrophus magneticus TaxID=1609969 RepID=A0A0F0CPF6_9BACT|nr:hypothetical protein OMAG_000979 [Candidatus Omnitrophus magneticus]
MFVAAIQRRMVENAIPNDIVILAKTKFDNTKDFPGTFAFTVNNEGIVVL